MIFQIFFERVKIFNPKFCNAVVMLKIDILVAWCKPI